MSNNSRTQYEESPIMAKKLSRNESERPTFMERQQSNNTSHYQPTPSNKAPSSNSTNNNNNSSNIYATQNYGHAQEPKALIIGSQVNPNDMDEMERKKEKIMLLSLQRRQQQEEAKAQKEIEAMRRREREQEKEDEKARKKEEMAARRAIILEQHRLKKAVEEAEREGKSVDQADLRAYKQIQQQLQHQQSMQAPPKLRQNKNTRPRPKTIHVESGSIDLSDASSLASRGKRGSNSNLTGRSHFSSAKSCSTLCS
jgi:calmodulin-regulated spectrin-associated protein